MPPSSTCFTFPHWQDTPGRDKVRYNATTFLLVAHRERCVLTCAKITFIGPAWTSNEQQWKPQLFSGAGHLVFVAIGISGPLPRTMNGNYRVVIIKHSSSKLTQVIFTAIINSMQIPTIFWNNCLMPYWIPSFLLTDYGPHFWASSLKSFSFSSGKDPHSTAYHRQTNGQRDRYNRTKVAIMRQYVSKPQRDCDMYIQPQPYSYHTQTNCTTEASSFNIIFRRELQSAATFGRLPGTALDMPRAPKSRHTNQRLLECVELVKGAVEGRVAATPKRYKTDYDKNFRWEQQRPVDDEVHIDSPTCRIHDRLNWNVCR